MVSSDYLPVILAETPSILSATTTANAMPAIVRMFFMGLPFLERGLKMFD